MSIVNSAIELKTWNVFNAYGYLSLIQKIIQDHRFGIDETSVHPVL